ncbi:MAG TPA: membrane protein insertion efficiency factor YidD [Spirochaetota bacterium]|nr:membrane protein insertion efficiency factor YidD [Spirochaetota bacterium]
MKGAIPIACLILALAPAISLADEFAPWNADVAVGDASTGGPHRHAALGKSSVYNGAQAGAWFLIRFFQVAISPQDGPNCRYHPTCARYGREAVEAHGALAGSVMAGDRLIRCNPFNPPGNDPVPKKLK